MAWDTEGVPVSCNCGAQPPEDARFCHKCGRPLFEPSHGDAEVVSEVPPPLPEAAIAAPAPSINFQNGPAVRAAFLAALLASLLITLVPPAIAFPWMVLWLLASGYLATRWYTRRTGAAITVRDGARLGWISGVFCFVIETVFFTIVIATVATRTGLAPFFKEQLTARGSPQTEIDQLMGLIQNPAGMAAVIILSMGLLFIFFTLLPTLGGVLGAKMQRRSLW